MSRRSVNRNCCLGINFWNHSVFSLHSQPFSLFRTDNSDTALYASDLVAELTFFSSLASETPPSRRFGRLSVRVLPCRRPSRAQISIK